MLPMYIVLYTGHLAICKIASSHTGVSVHCTIGNITCNQSYLRTSYYHLGNQYLIYLGGLIHCIIVVAIEIFETVPNTVAEST